jgi:hypothetical protein
VVPSSLGANPQMTIMALALRTAEALDESLTRAESVTPRRFDGPANDVAEVRSLAFEETMSGTMRDVRAPTERRPISFSLRARSRGILDFLRTREVEIEGELMAEGFGARCPLSGTLGMDVLLTRRIPYDFAFTADDGREYRVVGEKRVDLSALRRSMTHLPARILDDEGREVAATEVTFDLDRDLWSFLRSFRIARS